MPPQVARDGMAPNVTALALVDPNRDHPMALQSQMRSNETVGKRLLNVGEAARYLGLEVDTVYRKARLRELPSVKVGRALRFDVKALERYIEQHTFKTID
jgi:excisionase family DNA binding protein